MVAVGILAMLTAIAVPAFQRAKHQAQATVFAAEMKQTIEALEMYQGEQGQLPASKLAYNTPPDGFSNYLPKNSTLNTYSAMGGRWVWLGGALTVMPGRDEVLGVYMPTVTDAQLEIADRSLDDGSLTTGNFRRSGDWYFAGLVH